MSNVRHPAGSELQASDEAYEKLFQETTSAANARICDIPLDKLTPFFTADIGFRPYTPAQREAFAEQIKEERLSQFIKSVYVYRDYTLEIEFNVSFEDFRTMATECQEQGRNQQPVVYVTA